MGSLLAHLYARPELFRQGHPVYLRKPEEETDEDASKALAHLREQIGGGPFCALRIRDTPDSGAAPQCITLSQLGSNTPMQDQHEPLTVCGYYLASFPQE